MNSGKILLVKMGKGRFGPTVSGLLANQLVTKFKMAAMQRGDMPSEKRRDFFLYVDEAHNLPVENFMELLSEARKYRMGLVLATQYAVQLSGKLHGQDLLSAVMGNVGTLLFFRVGQEDAPVLASMLQPRFNGLDLDNLPDWQGYTKLQLGRSNVQSFSFVTEKDESPWNEFLNMRNRDLSRERYGRPADEVDEEIAARRERVLEKAE